VLALDLLAAVAEEAFFRRLVYGGLLRFGVVAALGGSALLFAAVRMPMRPGGVLGRPGAGLLFSRQRWASGTGRAGRDPRGRDLLAVLR
jgi:membrane protease YdiL (CAAX protease family)